MGDDGRYNVQVTCPHCGRNVPLSITAGGDVKRRRTPWKTRQPKTQTLQMAASWRGDGADSLARVGDGQKAYRESPVRPFYVESDVIVPLFHSLISGGMAGVAAVAGSVVIGFEYPLAAGGVAAGIMTFRVWAKRMELLPSLVMVYEEVSGKDVDGDKKVGRGQKTIWTWLGGVLGLHNDRPQHQEHSEQPPQGQPRVEMRGEPVPGTWDELAPEKQVRDVAYFVKVVSERLESGLGVGQKQFRELGVVLPSGFPVTDEWHSDIVGKLKQVGIIVAKGTAWELAPGVNAQTVWERMTPVYW